MAELRSIGYEAVVERVLKTTGDRPVCLCYDMDFFDPSVAPGVCTPTWGGCQAHEGLAFLKLLQPLDTKLLDVNTVSPPRQRRHDRAPRRHIDVDFPGGPDQKNDELTAAIRRPLTGLVPPWFVAGNARRLGKRPMTAFSSCDFRLLSSRKATSIQVVPGWYPQRSTHNVLNN